MTNETDSKPTPFRIPWWFGWVLMTGIALFFLGEEHDAHILGALPWLLLLACPIIHLLMHDGHGHGGEDHTGGHVDAAPNPTTKQSQHGEGRT